MPGGNHTAAPATRLSTQATSTAPWRSDSRCSSVTKNVAVADAASPQLERTNRTPDRHRRRGRAPDRSPPRLHARPPVSQDQPPTPAQAATRFHGPPAKRRTDSRAAARVPNQPGPKLRDPSIEPRPHPCPDEAAGQTLRRVLARTGYPLRIAINALAKGAGSRSPRTASCSL